MKNLYERSSDYGGQLIKESKKGWVINGWSRYQGNQTDYRFLIPFGNCPIKQGEDLNVEYADNIIKGEYLLQNYWITMNNESSKIIKVLNRGYEVR